MAVSLKQRKQTAPRQAARLRRQIRGRKKIFGTAQRPRLVVTRSTNHLFVQLVDDELGRTLASASTMESQLRSLDADKTGKARKVGEQIAQRAKDNGLTAVIFDRAGNRYAGRIAAMADSAREGGLEF